jgi:hypothetical protein
LSNSRSSGLALPLLLLFLLALSAFGHSALLLSRRELQAVWAYRHYSRASAAAEIGLRLAWGASPDSLGGRVPWTERLLVDGETEDGLLFRGTRRWLDQEYFLLEGIGGSRGWEGEQRAAWIGWTPAPGARVRAFLSHVQGTSAAEEPSVRFPLGPEAAALPAGWPPSACDPHRPVQDTLLAEAGLALFPEKTPKDPRGETAFDGASHVPSLGLLSGPTLLSFLRGQSKAEMAFALEDGSGCPGSGSPTLYGTPGDFVATSGRICGLIVVGGNFSLGGDATFQGLALVGGDVRLHQKARFEGMLRAGNRFFQMDEASFRVSFCPVLRAVDWLSVSMRPILVELAGRGP